MLTLQDSGFPRGGKYFLFPQNKTYVDERWEVVPAGSTLLGWPNYGVDGRLSYIIGTITLIN
jgi:hypothetical protein